MEFNLKDSIQVSILLLSLIRHAAIVTAAAMNLYSTLREMRHNQSKWFYAIRRRKFELYSNWIPVLANAHLLHLNHSSR